MTDGLLQTVPRDHIHPNPDQPRKRFSETDLRVLADSIASHGVLQPLVVTPRGQRSGYLLVAGERRWRAAGLVGLAELPCVVRDVTDDDVLVLATIENVNRADMSIMEEARAVATVVERSGVDDAARQLGRPTSWVERRVALMGLTDLAAQALEAGAFGIHAALLIATLEPANQQLAVRKAVAGDFPTDGALRTFCKAARRMESQDSLFGEPASPQQAERARAARQSMDRRVGSLNRAADVLADIRQLDDAELVLLGRKLADMEAACQQLASAARSAHNRLATAGNLAQLSANPGST